MSEWFLMGLCLIVLSLFMGVVIIVAVLNFGKPRRDSPVRFATKDELHWSNIREDDVIS